MISHGISSDTPGNATPEDFVFIEARDAFLNSLQPAERERFANCDTIEQVIEDLKRNKLADENPSLIRRAIGKLDSLNKALSPYFEALGFFVQSHPEFSAIAWGAIRLAFQLASHYVVFFERLTQTLGRFANDFPRYNAVVSQFKGKEIPKRLKQSLASIYTDMLRFFQSVLHIFTKKDGTPKGRPAVWANIVWKPYEVRFKDLLDDMGYHSEIIKVELQIATYAELREQHDKAQNTSFRAKKPNPQLKDLEKKVKRSHDAIDRIEITLTNMEGDIAKREEIWNENYYREEIVRHLQYWIDPPLFATDYERAIDIRESGTTEWLFQQPKFEAWRKSGASNLRTLWIHGSPGCGKTVLAASAIEELVTSGSGENTYYFFFRHGLKDLESATQAYKSIIAQALWAHRRNWALLDKYCFLLDQESSGQIHSSKKENLSIIQQCAHTGFIHNVILDGIDECSDVDNLIFEISKVFQGTSVRVLFFSRPHCIPLVTPIETQIAFGHWNSQDIGRFLTRKLHEFVQRGILPVSTDVEAVRGPLLTGANGMFLWAHLMLSYLESPGLTRSERVQVINSVTLPEGLEAMYDRIFSLLNKRSSPDQDLAKWILTWLAFSCRPLTATELEASLAVRRTDITDNIDFPDIDYAILTTCASLVEKNHILDSVTKELVPCFRLMHLSVAEYLHVRLRFDGQWFLLSAFNSHLLIAGKLLQYLHLVIKEVQRPTRPTDTADTPPVSVDWIRAKFPLCEYALFYWSKHLQCHRTSVMRAFKDSTQTDMANMSEFPSYFAILHLWRDYSPPSFASSNTVFSELIAALSPFASTKASTMAYIELSYLLDAATTFDHDELVNWLEWAIPLNIFEGSGSNANIIIQDIIELVKYMMLLKKDWGIALREKPFLIWDDVPSFTPHRLLPSPGSTAISSGFYTRLEGQDISSNYLCKISGIDASQKHVAILTIWPSTKFEQLSSQDNTFGPELIMELLESSIGWNALYEIWILDTKPKRLLMTRVELDKQDIWNQIRQSMTVIAGKLELHFPLSISPGLGEFAILRNLYSIQVRSSQAKHYTTHVQAIEYHLPINFDGIQPPSWPEGKTVYQIFNEGSNTWNSNQILVRYNLTFSEHGNRIFFLAHAVKEQMIHAAVFDLNLNDSRSISLAGPVQSFPIYGDFGSWPQVMHPNYPLVAFAGGADVYIWVYSRGREESTLRFRMPWPLEDSDPRIRLWKFSIPTAPGKPEPSSDGSFNTISSLAFSPNGSVLMASFTDRSAPMAIPIPEHVLNTCGAPSVPPQSFNVLNELQSSLEAPYKPSSSLMVSHVRSEAYQITPDGKMRGILATAHNGNIGVQLSERYISGDAEHLTGTANIDVVALPDRWRDSTNSTVSLQMPKANDMTLRVVVNREGKPSYNMQSDGDHEFPVIIDRDLRSLRVFSGDNVEDVSAQRLLSKEMEEDRRILQNRAMDNVDNDAEIDNDDSNDGGIALDYLDTGCESDYSSNGWDSD